MMIQTLIFMAAMVLPEQVKITDYGAKPDSRENALPAIVKALKDCHGNGTKRLVFPKGRYDIWPDDKLGNTGLDIYKFKDFTIEGKHADLVFHGTMTVARIDSCSNVRVEGFTIDWDRPFTSQCVVADADRDHLDVEIDSVQYPYVIENGKIFFTGEGWKLPVLDSYNNMYDCKRKEIVYNTWDNPLGNVFGQRAERLADGKVRFHDRLPLLPEKGTYVSLFHVRYYREGFFVGNSRDITLRNITLYHTLSCGVYGVRTENITLDGFSCTVNDKKDRCFSTIADASHFTNCRGTILVENCNHTGQGDDFINVHGRNVEILDIIDDHTVSVGNQGYVFLPPDSVWLVSRETAQRGEVRKVASCRAVSDEKKADTGFIISFTEPLPASLHKGDILENKSWNASFVMRNCKVLKRNRARGILVTTPKDVIIENNYFHTAGTAVLIEGDTDYWFESGANTNVQIRNNVFDNCLTSGNRDGNRWQWGDAVITITPSHQPKTVDDLPYHHDIHIEDNTFRVFDAPLVHARSVGDLRFENNKIVRTKDYKPYAWQKTSFLLEGCREVRIQNNRWDKAYAPRTLETHQMRPSDVQTTELERK